jgi:tungstate transport system substrate-binding protein
MTPHVEEVCSRRKAFGAGRCDRTKSALQARDTAHRTGFVLALALAVLAAPACEVPPDRSIILATTTSTYDSGLLDVLVPRFEQETGIEVKVIAVGTGAALRMAERGDADVVLAHAPAAEQRYVEAGDLVDGRRVMHNDFVIVGPEEDPAGVRGLTSAVEVMRVIAAGGIFVSRGDDSGTHTQELALWDAAGVDPRSLGLREETGQGMGATLNIAGQKRAYTLSDRGTYLSLRRRLDLSILFEGDPSLRNVYHVHAVNRDRHPGVRHAEARRFIEFLVSEPIQRAIAEFRRNELGQSLFVPDALPDGS